MVCLPRNIGKPQLKVFIPYVDESEAPVGHDIYLTQCKLSS